MEIRKSFSRSSIIILIPLILVMVLDLAFTLAGQPDIYWQNYKFVNEGSPIGYYLLSLHPLYFILAFLTYLLFILFLSIKLVRPLNIMVAVGFFLGHSWGSSSWLPIIFNNLRVVDFLNEWYLVISYFIVISIITGLCINKWLKIKGETF